MAVLGAEVTVFDISSDNQRYALNLQKPAMNSFSTDVFECEMAHTRFYDEEVRKQFPKCCYR